MAYAERGDDIGKVIAQYVANLFRIEAAVSVSVSNSEIVKHEMRQIVSSRREPGGACALSTFRLVGFHLAWIGPPV